MRRWLADTSVAVPLVQAAHAAHARVNEVVADRAVGLSTHSALETYSVLTRLPGDARLSAADAAAVIADRFPRTATLSTVHQRRLVRELAEAGIAGGAVYDALIALTARQDEADLLTRDGRAAATYRALGVAFELVI